jgi:mono/diheme cytochrome c family protein
MPDEDLAAVLTYMRNSWGNKASEITPEQVAAERAATASHSQPWTSDELLQVK